MENELNPAKIVGECAVCGHLFDICRNGFLCDACGNKGNPKSARLVTEQEKSARSEIRARLKDRRTRIKSNLTEFEKNSIAECEAIYALDSTGSRP